MNIEELLEQIGEYVVTEIDGVKEVHYLDKEIGNMFIIEMNDGTKVILSLIDGGI